MRRKLLHDLAPAAVVLCVAAIGPAAAQVAGGSPAPFDEAALHGQFVSNGGWYVVKNPGQIYS